MTKREKFLSVLVIIFMFTSILQTVDGGLFNFKNLNTKTLKEDAKALLKGVGIVALIKQFGPALNDAANKALNDKSVPNVEATKVVPILTVGQGLDAGACQITGPKDKVDQVKMVYAVESTLDKGEKFYIQGLVPSTSMNPAKIDRVYGVGVVSMITYKTTKSDKK